MCKGISCAHYLGNLQERLNEQVRLAILRDLNIPTEPNAPKEKVCEEGKTESEIHQAYIIATENLHKLSGIWAAGINIQMESVKWSYGKLGMNFKGFQAIIKAVHAGQNAYLGYEIAKTKERLNEAYENALSSCN